MTTLPDFNFIDVNPQTIVNEMINDYEILTGRRLAESDPVRLFILAQADKFIQLATIMNDAAKQNLLFFSRDDVLDFKGDEWQTPRLGNNAATTNMRFVTSIVQNAARAIPKGTLVTSGDEVYFSTKNDVVIPANAEFVDVEAECTTPGIIGNGYQAGEINIMVRPLVYISHCINLTVSEGGTGIEDDHSYRERIRQAPARLSTAGPDDAYEYFTKSASAIINDVHSYMSSPGVVTVKVLLKNGELPGSEIIDDVYGALSAKSVRPLTDKIIVEAPDIKPFDLNVTYYLPSNETDILAAQTRVEAAIDEYKTWQSEKMGRDINPSQLIWFCVRAGAKRIDITTPTHVTVAPFEVAQLNTENIVFGGVEDD